MKTEAMFLKLKENSGILSDMIRVALYEADGEIIAFAFDLNISK